MGSSLRGACRAAWCSPSTSSSSPSSGTVSFTRTRDRLGVGGAGGTQMARLRQLHQAECFLPSAAFPDSAYRHPAERVLGHRSGQPGQCPGAHQGGGHSNHLLMADHDSRVWRDVGAGSGLLLGMGALDTSPGAMPSLIKTVCSPEGEGNSKVATADRYSAASKGLRNKEFQDNGHCYQPKVRARRDLVGPLAELELAKLRHSDQNAPSYFTLLLTSTQSMPGDSR